MHRSPNLYSNNCLFFFLDMNMFMYEYIYAFRSWKENLFKISFQINITLPFLITEPYCILFLLTPLLKCSLTFFIKSCYVSPPTKLHHYCSDEIPLSPLVSNDYNYLVNVLKYFCVLYLHDYLAVVNIKRGA